MGSLDRWGRGGLRLGESLHGHHHLHCINVDHLSHSLTSSLIITSSSLSSTLIIYHTCAINVDHLSHSLHQRWFTLSPKRSYRRCNVMGREPSAKHSDATSASTSQGQSDEWSGRLGEAELVPLHSSRTTGASAHRDLGAMWWSAQWARTRLGQDSALARLEPARSRTEFLSLETESMGLPPLRRLSGSACGDHR